MTSITSIEDAVKKAKIFLREAGVPTMFCILHEAPIQIGDKWVVKFAHQISPELYTVELDAETGKVVGYNRERRPVK